MTRVDAPLRAKKCTTSSPVGPPSEFVAERDARCAAKRGAAKGSSLTASLPRSSSDCAAASAGNVERRVSAQLNVPRSECVATAKSRERRERTAASDGADAEDRMWPDSIRAKAVGGGFRAKRRLMMCESSCRRTRKLFCTIGAHRLDVRKGLEVRKGRSFSRANRWDIYLVFLWLTVYFEMDRHPGAQASPPLGFGG